MEIVTLSVTSIDASDRLRPVDDDYAAMIGANMAEFGQRAPIEVLPAGPDGKYKLIAGAHRLRGAELNDLPVLAVVRHVSDLEAQLLEVDENLATHRLNPLDEAVFMAKRQELYHLLYPSAKAGGNRRKNQNHKFVDLIQSFPKATAEKLGVSTETVRRTVARATNLSTEVKALIRGTWIARRGAHLDRLGALPSEEQLAVVQLLLQPTESGTEMTVAEAVRQVRQTPEKQDDPVHAAFWKIKKAWEKAGREEPEAQAQFLRFIGATIVKGRGK